MMELTMARNTSNVRHRSCLTTNPMSETHGAGRNPSPTAASFLKPGQTWDDSRTFLQALREKYMPGDAVTGAETVYFSSKKAEEIGFDKFARRQAQLQGIHTLVLDHMRIRPTADPDEREAIKQICGHVTELDLSGNLFESLQEILELAALLPKLLALTLNSNRLAIDSDSTPSLSHQLPGVLTLSLAEMYLSWPEIALGLGFFPNIVSLSASHNGLTALSSEKLPHSLKHIILSENNFTSLSALKGLSVNAGLETVALKRCRTSRVWDGSASAFSTAINENICSLDLTSNEIASWSFYNELSEAIPTLRHLHVAGNPVYKDLRSAEGKPLTSEDGYMLTIARLPQLETLNYSKISVKERLNAEIYYLSQIVAELSQATNDERTVALKNHPRWIELCEEYGEPAMYQQSKKTELDPNTLAARLVTFSFELAPGVLQSTPLRSWTEEIPKAFNIYALLGIVGKKLNVAPLKLRLVWQTGERDPVGQDGGYTGPEWWDSSDEEDRPTAATIGNSVAREVMLVAGTRAVGTYIEGRKAHVRIELDG